MKKNISRFAAILLFTLTLAVLSDGQTTSGTSEKLKDKNQRQEQQDKPLKINSKPFAKPGGCSASNGMVTLRITFAKSAKITNIEIVKSSDCDTFDRYAVKAARGIKFEPAMKGGEPITITKLIQYNFTRY